MSAPPAATWLLTHLPHFLPVLAILAAIGWAYHRSITDPPAGTVDRDRWLAEQDSRRRAWRARPVRPSVARRGLYALGPLVAAVATGVVIYGIDVAGDHPGSSLAWVHSAVATLAVLLVAYKLADLGWKRLRNSIKGEAILDSGLSLLAVALIPPLLVTGVLLLLAPSSVSFVAYAHLVAGAWWTLLVAIHLRHYLKRALRAVSGRRGSVPVPATPPTMRRIPGGQR
jgi:hypothetical protein